MVSNSTNSYRYERKFVAPSDDLFHLESIILNLPGLFTQLYPPRRINNVYFDSHDLEDFDATINGEKERSKVRLRWYGETWSSNVSKPQLEIKIKSDQANTKKVVPLDEGDSNNLEVWVREVSSHSSLPAEVKECIAQRRPTLVNTYYRHYYRSADRKFRLTVDLGTSYQAISRRGRLQGALLAEGTSAIIELKYDIEDQSGIPSITESLPYRLSRNSKYRNGIHCLAEHGYL